MIRRAVLVLALLLALPGIAHATAYVRYVDTTASPGGDGSVGNPFQSWNQADGDSTLPADLIAGNHTIDVYLGGSNADTSAVTVSGFTVDLTNYFKVQAVSASWAGTVWSTSKYRLELTTGDALVIDSNGYQVRGVQIATGASAADSNTNAVQITADNVILDSCFLRHNYTGTSYNATVLFISSADASGTAIFNSVIVALSTRNSTINGAVYFTSTESSNTHSIYSSVIVGARFGLLVNNANATVTAKNVYSAGGTSSRYSVTAGTLNQTNCAASDTTAAGTAPQDSVALSTTAGAYFTNDTPSTLDVQVTSDSSTLVNNGTTTSGESAPLNFTWDIRGYTRVATWDIGAYDYAGTAPVAGGIYPFWLYQNEVIE